MKNTLYINCRTATNYVKHCVDIRQLANSPMEIEALYHVDSCTKKKCIEMSIDYFEQVIRGRFICGAFTTPNVNYHK